MAPITGRMSSGLRIFRFLGGGATCTSPFLGASWAPTVMAARNITVTKKRMIQDTPCPPACATAAGAYPFWGTDKRAACARGANPGTDSPFPANCAENRSPGFAAYRGPPLPKRSMLKSNQRFHASLPRTVFDRTGDARARHGAGADGGRDGYGIPPFHSQSGRVRAHHDGVHQLARRQRVAQIEHS